jgi:hypothetical protein
LQLCADGGYQLRFRSLEGNPNYGPRHRGKKRLNRVFDAIGFVYPDYRYPLRGQGKKRKVDATAAPVGPVPEATSKKLKMLTHRSCYIEPVVVPELGAETSSAAKAKRAAPTVQST